MIRSLFFVPTHNPTIEIFVFLLNSLVDICADICHHRHMHMRIKRIPNSSSFCRSCHLYRLVPISVFSCLINIDTTYFVYKLLLAFLVSTQLAYFLMKTDTEVTYFYPSFVKNLKICCLSISQETQKSQYWGCFIIGKISVVLLLIKELLIKISCKAKRRNFLFILPPSSLYPERPTPYSYVLPNSVR